MKNAYNINLIMVPYAKGSGGINRVFGYGDVFPLIESMHMISNLS